MVIVGIAGARGAGKDAAAAWLVEKADFMRVGFADALKAEVRQRFRRTLLRLAPYVMPLRMEYIDGDMRVSQGADEASVLDWLFREKPPIVRELLQEYGTDVRREDDPSYWLKAWHRRTANLSRVVVPDVRFPDEACFLTARGGQLLRIDRPGYGGDSHASETSLAKWSRWDAVLRNDGTLEDLRGQVARWWERS